MATNTTVNNFSNKLELRAWLRPSMLYLRGVIALGFVLITVFWPDPTLFALMLWVGAYFFIDGICTLLLRHAEDVSDPTYSWTIASGIIGIVAGAVTLFNPTATVFALSVIVGFWAVTLGALHLVGVFQAKKNFRATMLMRVCIAASAVAYLVVGGTLFFQSTIARVDIISYLALNALVASVAYFIVAAAGQNYINRVVSTDQETKERRAA